MGEVRDDCSIVGTCLQGHDNVVALQTPKFEFLFECASRAFLDGYYRECVTSIAAAFERFFEFYVRVGCRKLGVDEQQLEATWKPFANQSERQRGAFGVVYLLLTKRAVDLRKYDNGTWKELRNDCTHKGYLPTRAETVSYADWALKEIHGFMSELHETCAAEWGTEIVRGMNAVKRQPGLPMGQTAYTTIINTMTPDSWGKNSFEEVLPRLETLLRHFEQVAAKHAAVTAAAN
jgi:hypothetical protein